MSFPVEPFADPGRTLAYDVVDVFTDRAFAGNALAVVYGADDLSTEQLHSLAMEFNLSETAFPVQLTPDDLTAGADYRVRIFTPAGEIPFAGHPTLGTAWALKRRGLLPAGRRTQACGAGLIGVHLPDVATGPVTLTAAPRDEARELSPAESSRLAAAVGLSGTDVAGPAHVAGCGLTWLYLRVAEQALAVSRPTGTTVDEIAVDPSGLRDPLEGVCVYAVAEPVGADGDPIEVHARVYVPGLGIAEDPATGSAAAGLGLALVAGGLAASEGESAYRIRQGVEMGRPSVLTGRVGASGGTAQTCQVSGQVVAVAGGSIAVP